MKNESILIAVVALIVGVLGGYLVFSISSSSKSQQMSPAAIPSGSGSPTDYARRIAEAEKIVAQNPKNLNAWISLGNDYFDTEQAQKAVGAYSKALELDPNNTSVLTDQGVMYRKLGWYDKALANFEKALKIDPKHLQTLYNIGLVYSLDMKQPDKGLPYWKKFVEIDPTSPTSIQVKGMIDQYSKSAPPAAK